jgi:hypothetical protein
MGEHLVLENSLAMERCLMKIWRIRCCKADASDYSMFLASAQTFLQSRDNHTVFVRPICKGFKMCKRRRIISLLYSLSSFLRVDRFFIDEKTIMDHFRYRTLRPSILQCVNSFNLCLLDAQIRHLVIFDQSFVCKSLYELVRGRRECVRDFMFREDTALSYKQLEFIVNCSVTYNLEYFVRFLGSQSRILAFKAFEAFNTVFQELESGLACSGKLDASSLPQCISLSADPHSPRLCLNIRPSSLVIEDPVNFLQFGSEFLEEWTRIPALIELCKTDARSSIASLNTILNRYAESVPVLDGPRVGEINLCHRRHVSDECKESVSIQNFDFLFEKRSLRDVCDCYEF